MNDLSYVEIYKKRLNRYGTDYQSRLEGKRAREFTDFLLKSPNRVDFEYKGVLMGGVFERNKQDQTMTQAHLLTEKILNMPNGTILTLRSLGGETSWLIWWKEELQTSGYNRYTILRLTHEIEWATDGILHRSLAYFSTPATRTIQDSATTSTGGARVLENNNLHMFILPYDETFKRDLYLETCGDIVEAYRITEVDAQGTPGIAYLTVVPFTLRAPQEEASEGQVQKSFWMGGEI